MPVLTPYRRPLIFGGSFDPPHRGHIELPQRVAEAIGADVVVYVPAGRAPHKLDKTQTDADHRVAMLQRALQGVPNAVIRTDEVDRAADGRPSYTVDTLAVFAKELLPGARMRLLIGMDQVHIFESWRQWRRVIALAEPVVMRRSLDQAEAAHAPGPADDPPLPQVWERRVVDVPMDSVSSTRIRAAAAAGRSIETMVGPSVARYIAAHGLYRPDAP